MSVPRADRGVPSPVRGAPFPAQVNFRTIRIKKTGTIGEDLYVSQPQGTQGTQKAPRGGCTCSARGPVRQKAG
jgi:hypothetical protein